MKTDRASLAFARVCFFVMLFLSTACNRMDAGRLSEAAIPATPAVAAQPVAAPERLRVPEERLAALEAQLRAEAAQLEFADRNAIRYD